MSNEASPGRNLVVCLDGTWNSPGQRDRDRQVPTNVVKFARAIECDDTAYPTQGSTSQPIYYDSGVGTGGMFDKVSGALWGKGLSNMICNAYVWLVAELNESIARRQDDKIFLIGFSRGAFAVRRLAWLIGQSSIPSFSEPPSREEKDQLRKQMKKILSTIQRKKQNDRISAFREEYNCMERNQIQFVGVWDTVGQYGIPGVTRVLYRRLYGFRDRELGSHVVSGYHALAINETRRPYRPTLWDDEKIPVGQTIKQVWFPGVHSNIGGGYVDSGLSDRSLLWMIHRAEENGLRMDQGYIDLMIQPNWFGELRDSVGDMNFLLRYLFRILPCLIQERKIKRSGVNEELHPAAIERWGHRTKPEEPPENFINCQDNMKVFSADKRELKFTRAHIATGELLLRRSDPEPVQVVRGSGSSPYFLICEHAGNMIPSALDSLGLSPSHLLQHIAIDIGAEGIARHLSQKLDASLVLQRYSRLVVDCNRRPDVEGLIPWVSDGTSIPGNQHLTRAAVDARMREIFFPFHRRIDSILDSRECAGRKTILISVHTFTPSFLGVERRWHAAVVYASPNPFAQKVLKFLQLEHDEQGNRLNIGDNEPYAMIPTRDYSVPRHGQGRGIDHVSVEVRQDLVETDDQQMDWAKRIGQVLMKAHG